MGKKTCDICGVKVNLLGKHKYRLHDVKPFIYSCPHCDHHILIQDKNLFKNHLLGHGHGERNIHFSAHVKHIPEGFTRPIPCPEYRAFLPTNNRLAHHIQNYH